MKPIEVVVEGALTEDGQLILDEKPDLPAGRVRVRLWSAERPAESDETMWDVLDRIHTDQRARGYRGRSLAEAVTEVRALRDEWDEREAALEEFRSRAPGTHAEAASEAGTA